MKLVEILARGLTEWPAKAVTIKQNGFGTIFGALDESGDVLPTQIGKCEIADDYDGAVVTRAMWEAERKRTAPDWSKAPEGATHAGLDNGKLVFYRNITPAGYQFFSSGAKWADNPGNPCFPLLFERPVSQSLNARMDIITESECRQYRYSTPCTVIGEYDGRMVIVEDGENKPRFVDRERLHPHMTEEQLAAEERDKAIAEMMEDAEGSATRATLELLYDAGYRRE